MSLECPWDWWEAAYVAAKVIVIQEVGFTFLGHRMNDHDWKMRYHIPPKRCSENDRKLLEVTVAGWVGIELLRYLQGLETACGDWTWPLLSRIDNGAVPSGWSPEPDSDLEAAREYASRLVLDEVEEGVRTSSASGRDPRWEITEAEEEVRMVLARRRDQFLRLVEHIQATQPQQITPGGLRDLLGGPSPETIDAGLAVMA